MSAKETFVDAIQITKFVRIHFFSMDKGLPVVMDYIPLDFDPREGSYYSESLYHCLPSFEPSAVPPKVCYLRPKQVYSIAMLERDFEPQTIMRWNTIKTRWLIPRD
jgi:hypothetical protein